MRIGVDVGGTFTDVVLVDDVTGQFHYAKVPTTPPDLWIGVLAGIDKILTVAKTDMGAIDYIVHGTTIGTNAIIERKGVRTGLITTAGFVDVLEIGRVQRPETAIYNLFIDNPPPLVPRYLRRGVIERLNRDGNVIIPIDEDSVRAAARDLQREGVESIAVCLLFSFMNPAHEERVAEIIGQECPEAFVSLSKDLAPEFREYERTSTTVINAYLQPIMKRYLDRLAAELYQHYGHVNLRIMQANGGSATVEAAKRLAVHTVNSGPAGGALAAAFVGSVTRHEKLIAIDMGGTSFDISVAESGVPKITSNGKFEGLPVKIPMIEINAIGAGGGSLAWVDQGNALNMGPESAGARPGPACYGLGGNRPTCTDANLVLGRLNPDYFLGGEMRLNIDAAKRAIWEHVAAPLGIDLIQGAAGMIRVINAKMAKGISVHTVQKGLDVREFAMVSFGGAASVHAVDLAIDLGLRTVIMPPLAGNLSALGLLVSDARHDYVQTIVRRASAVGAAELDALFREMEKRGLQVLIGEGFKAEEVLLIRAADLRYEGQAYELTVPVEPHQLAADDVSGMISRFHDLHRRLYSYSSADEPVQIVNIRLSAVGQTPQVRLPRGDLGDTAPAPAARKGGRPVYFFAPGFVETTIYERELLQPGNCLSGPAVVEERTSALVIPPGWTAYVDPWRNIMVTAG